MSESRKETIIQKTLRALKLWTIEPALLIHMVASFMGNLMLQDLMIDRACRVNLNKSDSICDPLTDSSSNSTRNEDLDVQKVIADMNIWRQVLDNSFPVICVLFLGAWSDIHGRKLPFLLPVFGYILRYIGLLLTVYYSSWKVELIAVMATLPIALTGSRVAISLATYSYITDTTSVADRTLRIGVLTAIRTFGKSLGSAMASFLSNTNMDYVGMFALSGGMELFAFIFALFVMKNTRKENAKRGNQTCQVVRDFFNLKNITESAKAFFRKREGLNRIKLFLLVIVLICTMGPMQGEESVFYVFTRQQLGWKRDKFGLYNSFRMVVGFIGSILSMGILCRKFKFSDAFIGILSCTSQFAASFMYAFAQVDYVLYLAPIVDILNGTMIVASRSMISKLIMWNEIGKVNSFIATIEAITPLPANPLYGYIYRWSLDTHYLGTYGAFFLLSAVFTIPPFFIFGWFCIKDKGLININSPSLEELQNSSSSSSSSSCGIETPKTIEDCEKNGEGYFVENIKAIAESKDLRNKV